MPKITYNSNSLFFLHIPKTSGTSLYANLRKQGAIVEEYKPYVPVFEGVTSHHLDYNQCKKYFGNFENEFAIIRDPWKRTLSEYVFRTSDPSFKKLNNWLLTNLILYQKNPCIKDNHLKPMTEFISNQTTLFNFENLSVMYNWIRNKLEYNFDFSDIQNPSLPYNYIDIDEILSNEVAELWRQQYFNDIQLYNSLDN